MSLKKTKEYPKIDTHEFTVSESINGFTPLNCDVTTLKRILLMTDNNKRNSSLRNFDNSLRKKQKSVIIAERY